MKFRDFIAESQQFDKQLIDTFGRYKVFKVNGHKVRQASPALEEFGGSSSHSMISAIPKDEIWIEDDVADNEVPILVSGELFIIKLMQRGLNKNQAYQFSLQKEKKQREIINNVHSHPEDTDGPVDPEVYVRLYGRVLSERLKIWLVDGEQVRNRYKCNFIEGGHGYVYPWIPNDEIWIEYGLHARQEAPLILLHEFTEMMLMKYHKMPYEKAHRLASKVEFQARETSSLSRHTMLSFTKDRSLKLVKNLHEANRG